ncbi:unnamed protein product [Effrenium voratum]|nr:unnamed protein product [Effrenium voratum]CAJ1435850.1 unnamed protein product [Effrenium voratum]
MTLPPEVGKSCTDEDLDPRFAEVTKSRPVLLKEEEKGLLVPLVVAAWIVTSTSTLIFNKQLFSGGRFPFPLTLLTVHQGTFAVVLNGFQLLAPMSLQRVVMPGAQNLTCRMFLRQFLPLGALQAVAMATQNEALSMVSAHAVIMVSASKPVLVALLQVCFGLAPFSPMQLKVLLCVALGVAASVTGEVNMSLPGFIFLCAAQITESSRIVLMQRLLGDSTRELDVLSLLAMSSPACLVVLLTSASFFELAHMDFSTNKEQLLGVAASTGLAFMVNVISAQVIKVTSALALTLLGVIKDFLGVFLSSWLFAAPISAGQVAGYAVAVLFINLYKAVQRAEAGGSAVSALELLQPLMPRPLRMVMLLAVFSICATLLWQRTVLQDCLGVLSWPAENASLPLEGCVQSRRLTTPRIAG